MDTNLVSNKVVLPINSEIVDGNDFLNAFDVKNLVIFSWGRIRIELINLTKFIDRLVRLLQDFDFLWPRLPTRLFKPCSGNVLIIVTISQSDLSETDARTV